MSATIQIRGDTAANWTAANPILADRELAVETDTQLFKVGNGVTAWNSLSYRALRQIDTAEVVNFSDQTATPTAPPSGMNFYARDLAGRMLPRVQGPSGLVFPLQPSFFQNQITIISPNTTTSVSTIGTAVTSAGTLSHPAATPQYGFMTDFASGATINNTAGTSHAATNFARNNTGISRGFFYASRIALPNTSYNGTTGATGSRIYSGMAAGNIVGTSSMVLSDTPAIIGCGFQRVHNGAGLQQANWQFLIRNAATDRIDTGLAFLPEKVYDMFLFCPPDGSFIGWRIDNVTDDLTQEGIYNGTQLPALGTLMRGGVGLATLDAVNRNIRMQRIYCESDV